MKKLILFTICLVVGLMLYPQPAQAQFRFQTAGCVLARSDVAPEYSVRFGMSKGILKETLPYALYAIAFGKYGESIKGGDLEIAFFPVRPTGKGLRVFFVAGPNYTVVDNSFDPVTYLQFTSGMGLYWDFSSTSAIWGAFKLEQSEDLKTVYAGIGLSTEF